MSWKSEWKPPAKAGQRAVVPAASRPLWRDGVYFALLMAVLIFANRGAFETKLMGTFAKLAS